MDIHIDGGTKVKDRWPLPMVHSMVFQSKALEDHAVLSSFACMNIEDSGEAGRTTRFKKVVTKSEV